MLSAETIIALRNSLKLFTEGENKLRGANKAVFDNQDGEIIIEGPAGTGKSLACLFKLHTLAMDIDCPIRILILRKSRASLNETALKTFEDDILKDCPGFFEGKGGKKLARSHREKYVYPTGSEIVLGGLDYPEKYNSSDYDIVYFQQLEECSEADWEILNNRCRNYKLPYQQLIGDCNPDTPFHWIKRREARGSVECLKSKHEDNPKWYDGENWTKQGIEYIARLEKNTGVRLQRLRYGLWVAAEGIIFEEWSKQTHLVKPFSLDKYHSLPKIRVIDFGFVLNHAFCCQWFIYLDKDLHFEEHGQHFYGQCWIMYREIYYTERLVEVHARQIEELSRNDINIVKTICDHNPGDIETLRKHGVPDARYANKPKLVKNGIDLVKAALKNKQLFIFEDCLVERDPKLREADLPTCTAEEFLIAKYQTDRTGKYLKEEYAANSSDHGLKNFGYLFNSHEGRTVKKVEVTDVYI